MELGRTIHIDKIRSGGIREEKQDVIPREILLHLHINENKISVISCSPEDLVELVSGYIISNGYVEDYNSINIVEICTEDREKEKHIGDDTELENMSAMVRADVVLDKEIRSGYISSGCGDLDEKVTESLPKSIKSKIMIKPDVILKLNRKNLSGQKHKKALGGLHSASLFDSFGELITVREDIGRHNCLDKIMGHMLINDINPLDKMIFTSGRVSLDLVLKSVRMSIPLVITNSSVTHSAAVLAKRTDLTVIGYARGSKFNIYSYPERII